MRVFSIAAISLIFLLGLKPVLAEDAASTYIDGCVQERKTSHADPMWDEILEGALEDYNKETGNNFEHEPKKPFDEAAVRESCACIEERISNELNEQEYAYAVDKKAKVLGANEKGDFKEKYGLSDDQYSDVFVEVSAQEMTASAFCE